MQKLGGLILALSVMATITFTGAVAVSAATTTFTVAADFSAGNAFFDNTTPANNDLRLVLIDNEANGWYRTPYNGSDWAVEVAKDPGDSRWAADSCLSIAANPFSDASHFTVAESGNSYRTGTASSGTHELGLANGTLDLPAPVMQVSSVRFISHGAKVKESRYLVTVDRQTGADLVFSIPVPSAAESDRDGSGVGIAGGSWSRTGISGFDGSSTSACQGDHGDEIELKFDELTEIRSIAISYPTEQAPGIEGEWLGGPLGLTAVTIDGEVEQNFIWQGTYRSASSTAGVITSPDGTGGIWHNIAWNTSNFGANSDADFYVRCGSDANENGSISGNEWKAFDGGPTGSDAWQGPFSAREADSVSFALCSGTGFQYRAELTAGFDVSPRINDVTISYNPDADGDGFPTESVAGHPQVDCDDTNPDLNFSDVDGDGQTTCAADCDDTDPDVFVGAALEAADVADGTDRDCDGFDECFRDSDMDGQGSTTIVASAANGVCTAATGGSTNADDCLDSQAGVFAGNPDVVVGDGIDQDCNGFEECYVNADGDPYGIEQIIDESPDPGNTCEAADGEGVPQPFGLFDCDDTDPRVHPGVVGDPTRDCSEPVAEVLCDGKVVTIDMTTGASGIGTTGDDVILGTAGNDMIDAGDGNDTVCAGDGDDTVIGGPGNDMLIGQGGRDIMRGNQGIDVLLGGDGPDRLLGGIDGDTIDGGPGNDYLGGFGGDDTLIGGTGNEVIFGGFGSDTIDAGPGDDEVRGLIGNDTIDGGPGNDELDGDRGNDVIRGGTGDDIIRGGNASDQLFGDAGNDHVSGGKADDVLSGGAGLDDTCIGNLEFIADSADATCETIASVP